MVAAQPLGRARTERLLRLDWLSSWQSPRRSFALAVSGPGSRVPTATAALPLSGVLVSPELPGPVQILEVGKNWPTDMAILVGEHLPQIQLLVRVAAPQHNRDRARRLP
jgi:hypothetical protein